MGTTQIGSRDMSEACGLRGLTVAAEEIRALTDERSVQPLNFDMQVRSRRIRNDHPRVPASLALMLQG